MHMQIPNEKNLSRQFTILASVVVLSLFTEYVSANP